MRCGVLSHALHPPRYLLASLSSHKHRSISAHAPPMRCGVLSHALHPPRYLLASLSSHKHRSISAHAPPTRCGVLSHAMHPPRQLHAMHTQDAARPGSRETGPRLNLATRLDALP